MERRERVGSKFKRLATRCKRACYVLIAASVVALFGGLVLLGGIQGYGAIGIILSLLFLTLALIAGLVGLVVGGTGVTLAPERPTGSVGYCVTPLAAHGLDPAEPGVESEIALALGKRGNDSSVQLPSDPGEVVRLIERLGALGPWSPREQSAVWTMLVKAISEQHPHLPSFVRLERANALLGGGVPRIRLAWGLDPQCALNTAKGLGRRLRQTAVDAAGARLSGVGERAIVLVAKLGAAGILVTKVLHVFLAGSTTQTKQSIAGWALVVILVGGFFVGLRYFLKWRRVRAASWDVELVSSGFHARKRSDPLRPVCRVDAERCWVIVAADPDYRGELKAPRCTWLFLFPDEPGSLEASGFDPSGTPWETGLRQMSEAVRLAASNGLSDDAVDERERA